MGGADRFSPRRYPFAARGGSSVGRASASQAEGRGFEPRPPLPLAARRSRAGLARTGEMAGFPRGPPSPSSVREAEAGRGRAGRPRRRSLCAMIVVCSSGLSSRRPRSEPIRVGFGPLRRRRRSWATRTCSPTTTCSEPTCPAGRIGPGRIRPSTSSTRSSSSSAGLRRSRPGSSSSPACSSFPQRQTALVAKQAAEVDLLTGGRFRLGVGLGWNFVEFEALGEEFGNRGRRVEEQIEVLRRLWTEPVVDFEGRWHRIPAAGINPLPVQRPIPVWIGGSAEAAVRRAARIADGFFPQRPLDGGLAGDDGALPRLGRGGGTRPGRDRDRGADRRRLRDAGRLAAAAEEWRARGATHLRWRRWAAASTPTGTSSGSARGGARRCFLAVGQAAASFARVSARCSGSTFTSASTGMKFVSPDQRGTTCRWTWSTTPAPATRPRFQPRLCPCGPKVSASAAIPCAASRCASSTSPSVSSEKSPTCRYGATIRWPEE